MTKIEFRGKWYEQTEKVFSIENLVEDAMNEDCPERNVTRFICEFGLEQRAIFCDDEDKITITLEMIRWLTHDSLSHIPWLVKKEYLREEDKIKQLPNQWYKCRAGHVYYSHLSDSKLLCLKSSQQSLVGGWDRWRSKEYTPIDSPIITERMAERKAEKCVHNNKVGHCTLLRAINYHGGNNCLNNQFETCHEYDER